MATKKKGTKVSIPAGETKPGTISGGTSVGIPAGEQKGETVQQAPASPSYYGKTRSVGAEQKAQAALSALVREGVQSGKIDKRDAAIWSNPAYVQAVAYGGYTPTDVLNDQYMRRTQGHGGLVHPDIRRGTWIPAFQKKTGVTVKSDGAQPDAANVQKASQAAKSSEDQNVKDIVDSFTNNTLSYDEFSKSKEAKRSEAEFLQFFKETFGLEQADVDLRKGRLKEDTDTAVKRLLEDKGIFGDQAKQTRTRLDQDRAQAITELGLTESRGKEDFDRSIADLNQNRGRLTEDQQTALGRLESDKQDFAGQAGRSRQENAIQNRNQTEALQENLNQRNIFGGGIGDILRQRLQEEQGLRQQGLEAGIATGERGLGERGQDINRAGTRGMEDLAQQQANAQLGFNRFGQDIGNARTQTEQKFGRQFQDLQSQIDAANLGYGRQQKDVLLEGTRGTFDLEKALERRKQELEQQRQVGQEQDIANKYGQQLQQGLGVSAA